MKRVVGRRETRSDGKGHEGEVGSGQRAKQGQAVGREAICWPHENAAVRLANRSRYGGVGGDPLRGLPNGLVD
jgi:hypothetical protein